MKLILGSDFSFLLKYGYDLTGIPSSQLRVGYIITASKGDRDKSFIENVRKLVQKNANDHGWVYDEIDIEGKTKDELRVFFKDKNVIHIEGGNTFYLLKAIRETGFDQLLKEFIDEGKVYIGTSAGAYIMCPTIEVSDWDETGIQRHGVTDFTALNYVPFALKVHYKDEQESKVREKMQSLHYPLRILKDGQGIVVENGNYTFYGGIEETQL